MPLSKENSTEVESRENVLSEPTESSYQKIDRIEGLLDLLIDLKILDREEKQTSESPPPMNEDSSRGEEAIDYEIIDGYGYINVNASSVIEPEEYLTEQQLPLQAQVEEANSDDLPSELSSDIVSDNIIAELEPDANLAEQTFNIEEKLEESRGEELSLLPDLADLSDLNSDITAKQEREEKEKKVQELDRQEKEIQKNPHKRISSSEPESENVEDKYGAFKQLQFMLLGPEMTQMQAVITGFQNKIQDIENTINDRTELIELLWPIISELLDRKIADSAESREAVASALAPIIDEAILAKTKNDKVAIGVAIAAALPVAIAQQIRDKPTEIGYAIAPEIPAAIKEQVRKNPQAMVDALYPIIDAILESKRQEDKEALSAAIAPLLPPAISKQIRNNPQEIAQAIAPEIASAIKEQVRLQQDSIAEALAPEMGKAIKTQIEIERDSMVDALYTIIGSTIAKYMADVVRSINEKIENALSLEGFNRKIRAKMQGVSEAELIFKEAIPFAVRAVFLIHKASGLVIAEAQISGDERLESEMVAGMLTAIRSFVNDCIARTGDVSEIDAIDYGNSKIVLEVAGYCYLAVVTQGETPQWYVHRMQEGLLAIVESYGDTIKNYEGDPSIIPERVNYIIEGLVNSKEKYSKVKKSIPIGLLALSLVVASLIFVPWGYYQYRNASDRRIEKNTALALASTPELAIYQLSIHVDSGKLRLEGKLPSEYLRNKAEQIAKKVAPNLSLENKILAVEVPADPVLTAAEIKRVTSTLNQMNGVAISSRYEAGKVTVQGTVAEVADARKITQAFQKIPGVNTVTNTVQLQQLSLPIRIYFDLGDAELKAENKNKVLQVKAFLNRYQQINLIIVGHSDTIGTATENQRLALLRAETVRRALIAEGIPPKRLQAVGTPNPPLGLDSRQPLWLSRCVQFQPVTPGFKNK
ncbi:OmpA family protein [Aerosakkonema funiforme]|uniref:OmpA family protein n=1 Tax=Aerosakkonema funiforme FACHB-1375 TaxID=2949571 RepID=A0A926VED9_9CYAN|nr:OmpA family protein [Aerosakkonema funiforme]MBD2181698.1 OmpA family protein [Aerosakkonema funiforme FACHB-1375]